MKSVNSLAKLALKDAIKSKAPPSFKKSAPPKAAPSKDPLHDEAEKMDAETHQLTCPACGHTGSKEEFEG